MAEKPPPDDRTAERDSRITLRAAADRNWDRWFRGPLRPRSCRRSGCRRRACRPRRQLVEKVAGLYMVSELLDFRYVLVEARLLARSDDFLRAFESGEPRPAGGGLTALPARNGECARRACRHERHRPGGKPAPRALQRR